MNSIPTYLAHFAARAYYDVRQLGTRSRGLYSTRTRQVGLLIAVAFLLLLWVDPRLYHSLNPRDVLRLVPVPAPSLQLVAQLENLNATLFEHYRSHGGSLPEQVFPYQALTRAQQARYKLLSADTDGLYLFTTLIRQVHDQIPDLLAALTVVIEALGPRRVAFSFLEGPSDDLTASVFNDVLQPLLLSFGVPSQRIRIITESPAIDFNNVNRIEALAELRNEALQPLWQDPTLRENVKAVVFFNDVYLKAEHVLEMLYMHQVNGAGMTAAWDWYKREPAYFYDVWVARTVSLSSAFISSRLHANV
jgi:alpha-1,3-mannosyltransferase